MADDFADRFMRALRQTEDSGDPASLVALFAADAELENPARSVTRRGRDGAERFWREYLSAFGRVRSEFGHVHRSDRSAVMEWRSEGTLPTGQPLSYRGVSVIEFGDGDGKKSVRRFCTYYDSATFLPSGSKHVPADAEHAEPAAAR